MLDNLNRFNIILASKSPRRKQLLKELGINFKTEILEVEEIYPKDMKINEIPEFLSTLKAKPFEKSIDDQTLVISSDTIVCCNENVLGKPQNYDQAFSMLRQLSGKPHQVITGVCLLSKEKKITFSSITTVFFKYLTDEEIEYYIKNYQPYDKAGAYGIQEWIGHIAVERIEGSYFNVMGLPIQQLYEELCIF
jgi:septum formation protein